jgi:hypothetical protein
MSDNYTGPKNMRFEFGEMLQSLPETNDPKEKPKYYIKITAKDEVLDKLRHGVILEFESPKDKFNRMLASPKIDEVAKEGIRESLERIPKFFIKRVIAKIKQ